MSFCYTSKRRPPCMSRHVPHRISLHDQLVSLLKESISEGQWGDELPIEAALCREFGVSRMTLRKAIAQLAHERWLVLGGRGRRHSIQRRRAIAPKPSGRIIRVLTPYSLMGMGVVHHAALETVAEIVASSGYDLEFEHHPGAFRGHQTTELRRLDALPDTAGWLLFFSTEQIQRWFAASARPCVIAGFLHEGVQLSSVYLEIPIAARHAAGRFYACGHREMVYLIDERTSLGDRRASVAFVEEAHRLGAHARIVEHTGDRESVHRVLRKILAMRPRPSAFYASSPECALTTLCHLSAAKLNIPKEAAIIVGWDDEFLDHTLPTIARYRVDPIKYGRKIAAVVLDQLHAPGKIRKVSILPEFVNGGSLDPTKGFH